MASQMNNTLNPYEPSSNQSSKPLPNQRNAFLVGARNGFLWSLLLAVPTSFVFYANSCVAMARPFDPVTFARTRVPLTNAHRIAACVDAFVTAAGYIVLPWSLFAGVAKHSIETKRKKRLGSQEDEPG